MELAGAVVQVVEMISSPISKCWKHYKGINEYIETLKDKLEELNHRKKDVEATLEEEHNFGKRPKEEVEHWLRMVEKINREIKLIEQKSHHVKFPFYAGFGKNVLKKIQELDVLYQKGDFPNGIVYTPPQAGDFLPTTTFVGETTFKRNLEEIWACLIGDEVRKIGVYGMGGIGKTKVMKDINNRLLEEGKDLFACVIWITVSKVSNVSKLQDTIARRLGLELPDDEIIIRAAKLYARLKQKKRYVLIFDDLWETFALEDVGIPEPSHENDCKIVLTTRLLEVCRGMSCKSIKMKLLSEEEAWRLFLDTVGVDVLHFSCLETIMKDVAKECTCLPLAIITVAASLKGVVEFFEWKTALEELKAGSSLNGFKVLEKLEFSYRRLEDKNLQTCFLYCALFPEDFEIPKDRLIEYLIVEGIIKGMKTRQAEIEKGYSMLNKLVNSCLLEISDFIGEFFVKMHDLVRDMAINTASSESKLLVEAGLPLRCIPDDESWSEDLEKVSLMYNNISSIPFDASPKCPKLVTLLLNRNYALQSIPYSFFTYMLGLSVLDLSDTAIVSLPESLSSLVNLTALLLRRCRKLMYVPSLALLRGLRKLDLYGTSLTEVPQGVNMLTNLRYLNLYCSKIQRLPDEILSKLPRLECLFIDLFSLETTQVLKDLAILRNLESFQCAFSDINHFNACITSLEERGTPLNYKLGLGFDRFVISRLHDFGQEYCYYVNKKFVCLDKVVVRKQIKPLIMLPKDINIVWIDNCRFNAKGLCKVMSLEKLNHLRTLRLINCGGIDYLLCNYRGLSSSSLIFRSLTKLIIHGCTNLKKLFKPSLLSNLQNLEIMMVLNCKEMVQIMGDLSTEGEHDIDHLGEYCLPGLQELHLKGLPELESIYPTSITVVADSMQRIEIKDCPKLKSIPLLDKQPCPPPSLQKICIQNTWWESLYWSIPNAMDMLQPFCDFTL